MRTVLPTMLGSRVEIVFPGRPGKHRSLRGSGMVVIGAIQQAPEEGLDANDLEILPAYFGSPDWPRDAVGFQAKILIMSAATAEKTVFPSRTSRTSG